MSAVPSMTTAESLPPHLAESRPGNEVLPLSTTTNTLNSSFQSERASPAQPVISLPSVSSASMSNHMSAPSYTESRPMASNTLGNPPSSLPPPTGHTSLPQPPLPPPSMAAPLPPTAWPSIHLFPLNDTFLPKQISLAPLGSHIKIGRQTNAKTVPGQNNGYFDSKVLSRTHAEVWYEEPHQSGSTGIVGGGSVYIKDVGSSNGTFINGERLSAESVKSSVFELHSEDTVEFGIDIASEDNKTILHHKVSTKIHLALTQEEAAAFARNLPSLHRAANEAGMRRMSRAGVSSTGLSFDHVLARLQVCQICRGSTRS